MLENDLRKLIINNFKARGFYCSIIESNKLAGKPDVYAGNSTRSVWIEIKYREIPPKSGDLLSHKFSEVQISTMLEMKQAGIEVFGIIGTGDKKNLRLYKVEPEDMRDLKVGDERLKEIKFGEW